MDELHSILQSYRLKNRRKVEAFSDDPQPHKEWESSAIPDLFFDEILVHMRLTRIEILVFLYIYRKVWVKPNLYKTHGISPLLSYTEMAQHLKVEVDDIYSALKNLENLGLIETIRAGQYFVRRFFTKNFDEMAGQSYDDFDI